MVKKKDAQEKLPELDDFDIYDEEGEEKSEPSEADTVHFDTRRHDDLLEDPEAIEESKPKDKENFDVMGLTPDIPIQLVAVMAKKNISMKELVEFREGLVLDLQRPPSEMVDLVANGKLIARGELVEIDGKLGVRILKLVK
ncbi:MAG: FliM/FliN family flagellar motor switch protein [Deltaproteobacteria bacterium]|nr:FliM/FliN family flagellar motor switch protein [Deltaproteobacteria bacterium]